MRARRTERTRLRRFQSCRRQHPRTAICTSSELFTADSSDSGRSSRSRPRRTRAAYSRCAIGVVGHERAPRRHQEGPRDLGEPAPERDRQDARERLGAEKDVGRGAGTEERVPQASGRRGVRGRLQGESRPGNDARVRSPAYKLRCSSLSC
jgi:hypothetical protein